MGCIGGYIIIGCMGGAIIGCMGGIIIGCIGAIIMPGCCPSKSCLFLLFSLLSLLDEDFFSTSTTLTTVLVALPLQQQQALLKQIKTIITVTMQLKIHKPKIPPMILPSTLPVLL